MLVPRVVPVGLRLKSLDFSAKSAIPSHSGLLSAHLFTSLSRLHIIDNKFMLLQIEKLYSSHPWIISSKMKVITLSYQMDYCINHL